ncbi:S-adenosyl-L-methionine-dependent methyltransferase [Fomitopsis serialis]|uniref:S-adenosyl-L-methionine-dependent methyltransferase n=1 Tax=Fomitopsis serialis TaxID=139415 RepID=UPI0020084F95|nr:S-adenosyl-L-methionine-dependent methyltransferase [Neoantrodia serialis]KAH9921907.1 S-adenosyl-L-methionine-dependent methyltransferase [Neoantrodia serialis]
MLRSTTSSTLYQARAIRNVYRAPGRVLACGDGSVPQAVRSPLRLRIQRRSYVVAANHSVTPIEKILLDTIKVTGPISFGTYMQMCLSHPTEGYYMKSSQQVFGEKGDFTTSPEISQVFGELAGIWLLSQWLYAGNSRKLRLVELGPGRGTLMHDILRVLSQFSAAREAIEAVHLVETSPNMQQRQDEKLSPLALKHKWDVQWHTSIEEVPHDPSRFTLLVAHEFFDALPFNLIQKTQQGWQEVLIAAADSAQPTDLTASSLNVDTTLDRKREPTTSPSKPPSRFRRVLSRLPTASSTLLGLSSSRLKDLPMGSHVEISPTAFKIARKVGELVQDPESKGESSAGSALVVDYGRRRHSEIRIQGHKIVDVFDRPGECDLTVNVDFAYLKEALAGVATPLGPLAQGSFLTHMGLAARIEKAANRLVDKTGMGSQYQVMGVVGARRDENSVRVEERWPFVQDA